MATPPHYKLSMVEHVKVVIVGTTGIGKTSLLLTYSNNEFPGEYIPTTGFDGIIQFLMNGRPVSLHPWDTYGKKDKKYYFCF